MTQRLKCWRAMSGASRKALLLLIKMGLVTGFKTRDQSLKRKCDWWSDNTIGTFVYICIKHVTFFLL